MRAMRFVTGLVLVASVAVGGFWWFGVWTRGILSQVWAPESVSWILGFGSLQLLSWTILGIAIVKTRPAPSFVAQGGLLTVAVGVLCGNLVFFFTPVVAMPLLGLCILVLAVFILVPNRTWAVRERSA